MKITRNGQEYDLTFSELMDAHDEYELDCMIADVKKSFAQDSDYKDIELSDEQIRDIAENAIHNLSKNEPYGEAYWESVNGTLKDCINELLNNVIIKRTIKINFKNLVFEMKSKNLKLCFVHSDLHDWAHSTSLEDSQGNLYRIETYYDASPLNKLIASGAVVLFSRVEDSLNQSIEEWEKRYMDVSDVKDFIKRERYIVSGNKTSLDDIIDSCEAMSKNNNVENMGPYKETNMEVEL